MTFSENGGRPGDRRGFIHKSFIGRAIGGVAKKVISATPIGAAITTGVQIGRRAFGRRTLPRTTTARVTERSAGEKELARNLKFSTDLSVPSTLRLPFVPGEDLQSGPCDFPKVRDSAGRCRTPTSGEFGGEQFGVGEAVMGRYGAALQPGSQIIDRAICLRGMQLGDDGLCYNKSQITNKQRMWPAGRKPLLSGGDMRAISIAARAGRRLEGATKRLQRLGMMKKPTRRLGPGRGHAHAKPIAAVSV